MPLRDDGRWQPLSPSLFVIKTFNKQMKRGGRPSAHQRHLRCSGVRLHRSAWIVHRWGRTVSCKRRRIGRLRRRPRRPSAPQLHLSRLRRSGVCGRTAGEGRRDGSMEPLTSQLPLRHRQRQRRADGRKRLLSSSIRRRRKGRRPTASNSHRLSGNAFDASSSTVTETPSLDHQKSKESQRIPEASGSINRSSKKESSTELASR